MSKIITAYRRDEVVAQFTYSVDADTSALEREWAQDGRCVEVIVQTPEQMEAARVELAQLDSILMGDRTAQRQSLGLILALAVGAGILAAFIL